MLEKTTRVVSLTIALILTTIPSPGQDLPDENDWRNYEPVLFPIVVKNESGAAGTSWTSETIARNKSSEPLLYSFGLLHIPADRVLSPGELTRGAYINVVPIDGSLTWLQKGHSEDFSFSCRLFETSRAENADGIDLPVVTLDETYDRPFEILRVPVTENHRMMLRVYDLWSTPGGEVDVRIYRLFSGSMEEAFIGQIRLRTDAISAPSTPTNLSQRVGFVRLPLDEHIPPGVTDLRIEISPVTEGQALWAMVSLTHNETQRVSIVTPQ